MKKKGKEISVKKAAESLNLSERTVINFIKQKKIEAIKVGRDWFVDYASFVSFALKYDMRISETREELSEVSEIFPNASKQAGDFSEISEKFPKALEQNGDFSETNGKISEISETFGEANEKIPKYFEVNGDFSEHSEIFPKDLIKNGDHSEVSEKFPNALSEAGDLSEKFPKTSERDIPISETSERFDRPNESGKYSAPNLKRPNHITSLRVYELSKIIFSNHNFQFRPENKIEERLIDLFLQTLEGIGSGFYSYSWDEKKFHYSRARSTAGALMALISIRETVLTKWSKEGHELEEVLIPALGALIKTIEKKSIKEKIEGKR